MSNPNTLPGGQAVPPPGSQEESLFRATIARNVTYFALTVTGVLGFTAIMVALFTKTDVPPGIRFSYVKDILAIILPLVGTWVGTVLAFYFSKENFVAAAKQTSDLVKQLTTEQKLQSIFVADVMIKMDDASTIKLTLPNAEEAKNIKLRSNIIDDVLDKHSKNRLPVVDQNGKVLYLLHRSFIDRFVSDKAALENSAVRDLTLRDLLEEEKYKNAFLSFATVGKTAKLLSAKEAMDGNPNCSDIFVTEDGLRSARAVGWITNAIVVENAKV